MVLAVATACIAAVIIVWYLVRRPQLTRNTKIALLLGIGILPIATAGNGNVAGYHATKTTKFCTQGCHVMEPYGTDSLDPASMSLASRHARNTAFGAENCYACHADYGMFGTVTTKLGGLRHVYEYALHYKTMPIAESLVAIEIRRPFENDSCIRCHSMQTQLWNRTPDHASTRDRLAGGAVSCASEGCHGFAHPFSKQAKRAAGVMK